MQYSSVVIEQMRERYRESRPSMEWHEMDVRSLRLDDSLIDVAIDKGIELLDFSVGIYMTLVRNYGCHDDLKRRRLGEIYP